MGIRKYGKELLQKRKASKAYKKIVAERTLAVRRQAHEKESLKVAEEEGRAMARKPRQGFFSSLGEVAISAGKRAVTPQARAPVRRRTVARRPISRRRYAPVKRRVVRRRAPARRYAPVKRRRRRVARKAAPSQAREEPQNVNAYF